MTRINLVHPSKLCDQHLLAELRELPRIPNGVLSGKLKHYYDDAPKQYTLGAGHVKFFVDKLQWLEERYMALHRESAQRGFQVAFRFPLREIREMIGAESSFVWYRPAEGEIAVNAARISERMPPKPRYMKRQISVEEALNKLTKGE